MGAFEIILIVLEALCSIALIGVVLMQSGKEAGLSGALAGSSNSYMSKNKQGNLDAMLASSTKWIAMAWVILTLVLSLV
jgi:preprotein translocase subunit SecG